MTVSRDNGWGQGQIVSYEDLVLWVSPFTGFVEELMSLAVIG
jgi:hypothetical protein